MNALIGKPVLLLVDFGPTQAGLATVGYALKNPDGTTAGGLAAPRTTTGVVEHGHGSYGVSWTPGSEWVGYVEWDTGGVPPVYAHDDIAARYEPSRLVDYSSARAAYLDSLPRMLGLVGSNVGLRDAVYTSGRLTSYNLFVYDTAAHATLNDGATGVLYRYAVANGYDSSGNILASVTQLVL